MSGRAVAALAAAAVLLSGCGGGGSSKTPEPTAPAATTAPTATAAPTATKPPAGTTAPTVKPTVPGGQGGASTPATTTHWTSGPVTVRHNPPVPPVPVLVGVRYAAHSKEGFDRIVFDIKGTGLPGYSARYVSEVRGDPSDQPVSVPGRRFLLIVFTPAQAHRNDGTATVSGSHRTDLPMMRGYAVAGDYEGYVSVAIGLDDVVGYRIGELPGRVYVDVAA